jgi:aminoglycoside phosphotransferase (APT) family kinase protein
LRLFTNGDWLDREPDLAEHEAAALTHAARARVPVPTLIAHAGAAETGVPALLMTRLPGTVDLRPRRRRVWLASLAEALAAIHATDVGDFRWQYSSWNTHREAAMPAWLADSTLWSGVLGLAARRPTEYRPTFLHRDYHPTNVLWADARVSGVVDWVNACRGPAGVDVAHCRLNLALMYGVHHADDFLHAYIAAVGGYDHDPYWDVDDAMDWSLHDAVYYPPWRDFGLRSISRTALRARMREFLQSAVDRR